ncbi:MAG TPA: hypothetical protein VEA69_13350 [Tepidisphaeraceae bacterium]|nr:hypothetical protein [Tepidisphaeraceae bacterium]
MSEQDEVKRGPGRPKVGAVGGVVTAPPIPPREPEGKAEWLVSVRHTPIKVKKFTTVAEGKAAAWAAYLTAAEASLSDPAWRRESAATLHEARQWLANAKHNGPGPDVEIIGAEYVRKRTQALRVKGTVSQDQIGFPELASV